uniref:Uncharacterized protein n=1 Tax=Arundo donax TaxID=35708 RepID=A0A0A9SGY2_ARUDO
MLISSTSLAFSVFTCHARNFLIRVLCNFDCHLQ